MDYPGSFVYQEVEIELEEIIDLRELGLRDKTMDIDKLIKVQEREKIMTNNRVLENL